MKMLIKILLFFSFPVMIISCNNSSKSNEKNTETANLEKNQGFELVKKWETDKVLKTPESVCYDPEKEMLYVANIHGKPSEKDGNGFISTLSLSGEILELKWADSLNAPKGMGISEGFLYVTDISRVAKIDRENGRVVRYFEAEGAKFLNDITVGNDGMIYISDMSTNKIHKISGEEITVFIDKGHFKNVNGLYFANDTLFAGQKNCIKAVNPETGDEKDYIMNTGSIDGLEAAGNEFFLFSDWTGHVYIASAQHEKKLLLDTSADKINAADIEFIQGKNLLLVPTFFDNRVMAYEFVK